MIIKVNGSIQNLLDDDAYFDSILSASDEEILAQEKEFFADPETEARTLKTRLEQLGRAYTAGSVATAKREENFLSEISKLLLVLSEQIQSANQKNMCSISDQVTRAMEHNESYVRSIYGHLTSQMQTAHARLYAQIDNLKGRIESFSNSFAAMSNIEQTKNEFSDVFHQAASVNSAIEEMQSRSDRLRVSLKLQGEELMDSLKHIMRQLAVTGDAMSVTVDDVLREKAAANLKRFG